MQQFSENVGGFFLTVEHWELNFYAEIREWAEDVLSRVPRFRTVTITSNSSNLSGLTQALKRALAPAERNMLNNFQFFSLVPQVGELIEILSKYAAW